jgi:hypothetical protein
VWCAAGTRRIDPARLGACRSETHVVAVDARPQPFAFLSWGHRGSRREFLSAYLDPNVRISLEIQQPRRRMVTASVGSHHDQPFAIFEVDKGAGTRFAASSPCSRQEQGPASDDPRTDESSRVTVEELMELEVGKLQRSRGGVAHESHSFGQCPARLGAGRLALTQYV